MTNLSTQDRLLPLFRAAVASADPEKCLPPALPPLPEKGKLLILGAGKGSAAMVRAAEGFYRKSGAEDRLSGFAVTRTGFALPTQSIPLLEAGHPVPDENSVAAAQKSLALAERASEGDRILVLLSGGASALWTAPLPGITLAEKQALTRDLLASGAPIGEINCVRKHISAIKGGRLARAAAPAELITLAVSDVPGDDPSEIGSGPTVGDPTTLEDARAILHRRGVTPPASIARALDDPRQRNAEVQDDPVFANTRFELVARPAGALEAAARALRESAGITWRCWAIPLKARRAISAQSPWRHGAWPARAEGEKTALLSGGER